MSQPLWGPSAFLLAEGGEFGSGDRGGPGGWVILAEPELHVGGHILVPDLAGWRRARLPELPEGAIEVVPDFACEILSPATARRDRAIKLPLYASLGVAHAWSSLASNLSSRNH